MTTQLLKKRLDSAGLLTVGKQHALGARTESMESAVVSIDFMWDLFRKSMANQWG